MIAKRGLAGWIVVGAVVILAICASVLAVGQFLEARLAERISGGIAVAAEITDVSHPSISVRVKLTRVEVSYVLNGVRYNGPLMWVDGSSEDLERFHTGDTIRLYVDPSDPQTYATDEGGYGGSEGWFLEVATLTPGFVIFLLFVVIVNIVASRRRPVTGRAPQ